MLEVRERLRNKVTVIIDERDQEKLFKTFGDRDAQDAPPALPPSTVAKCVDAHKQVGLDWGRVLTPRSSSALWTTFKARRPPSSSSPSCATPAPQRRSSRRCCRPLDFCGYVFSFARAACDLLESPNRTNVALSRAKHGMYILGNAVQLASRSEMWRTIIHGLEKDDAVGPGLPVLCKRHQESKSVSEPGVLNVVSPDGELNWSARLTTGGCLRPCDAMLVACGHTCPRKVTRMPESRN